MTRSSGSTPVRRRLGRIAVAAAALGIALVTGTGLANAQPSGSEPVPYGYTTFFGANAITPAAQLPLTYHGGYIQDHVKVYLVFWGSQWTSDRNGVQILQSRFHVESLSAFDE